jgi:putative ABC transport system substrate-binding protein
MLPQYPRCFSEGIMRRRDFVTLVSGAMAAWPLGARAQEPGKIWRMGFIAQGYERFYDALFDGLRELGYAEGRNLIVERRYAEGHADRFPEFAAEMVRLKVDIIIVTTTPAALAVKNATATIPVVFPNAISPVESGVVASLAHPGGNVTGGAAQTATLSTKRLAILKEVVPRLSRGAVLWNAANPPLAYPWRQSQAAAEALGVTLQSIEVRDPRGYRGRVCHDRPGAARRTYHSAGCTDPPAPERDHRLRYPAEAAGYVCRKGMGRGRRPDVLWGEPSRDVSPGRILRG